MHILEFPSFFTPYGGEFCLDQAKALQDYGHEIRILSLVQISIKKSLSEYLSLPYHTVKEQADGVKIIKRYLRGIPKSIKKNQTKWVSKAIQMFDSYVLEYGKPDIIHAHCAKWAGYTAMLISKKYNIPYVITEHLPSGILKPEFDKCGGITAWQIPLLKKAYYNANLVIPVSEELVLDLKPFFGDSYNKIVLPNTINTFFFKYTKRAFTNNKFSFCCLAHFDYRKGYDILLPAFDKLCDFHPNTFLHIAGRDTDSSDFKKLLLNIKHTNNIIIHGLLNKEGVREVLYKSNVLVLASRSEAQSLVLLEAISTGLTIIATPCIAKSQKIGDSYIIVPFDDINALCNAMKGLIENPKDCYEASKFIHENYSAGPFATKLTKLFQNIISTHNDSKQNSL